MPNKGKKQSGGEHKPKANMRKTAPSDYWNSVDAPTYGMKTLRVAVKKKRTPTGEIPLGGAVLEMLAKQALAASKMKK
jgi:hypothetical protein